MREDSTFSLYMSLLAVFVPFSLVAIGGGGSVFAPIQRESVDVQHWITGREFIELFAIARVSPGPGSMLATVIGWKVAGWGGALVATIAMFLPSSILCLGVAQVWNRYRGRDWHKALETGLAPIGTGLMFAGVVAILKIGHGVTIGLGQRAGGAHDIGHRRTHRIIVRGEPRREQFGYVASGP